MTVYMVHFLLRLLVMFLDQNKLTNKTKKKKKNKPRKNKTSLHSFSFLSVEVLI